MTDKEKAKAYDEALAKAKEQYNYPCMRSCMGILEEIFPELKESEDEKIRGAIIDHLKDNNLTEWAAWLEKQKQQEKDILEDAILDGNEDGLIAETIRYKNEKKSEQKLDKVKPKFGVGDWLVHNERKHIIKVVNPTPMVYEVVNVLGYHHTITDTAIENNYHPWTIQDAKDGDVLATKAGGIFIYKELLYDKPFAYCGVDKFGVFKDCNCGNGLDWTPYLSNVTPATEEQRTELFLKMHEAGYEWDANTKELRKIEQKPANKIEPIFNVGDKIQYLKGCGTIMTIEKIENGEYIFANNMGHTTIENGNKCYLVEQKYAEWHREDEQNLNACLGYIPDEFLRRWLKDVVHTKYDKPAWSEEDEKFFKTALWHISYSISNGKSTDIHCDTTEWLKSLRPQNHWKPSEEQLNVLHDVAIYIDHTMFPCKKGFLMKLYKQLKKLKEE